MHRRRQRRCRRPVRTTRSSGNVVQRQPDRCLLRRHRLGATSISGNACTARACRPTSAPDGGDTLAVLAPDLPLHLAVALDGTGFHPASWRDPSARPADIFGAPVLGRPGPHGGTGRARLPDHRGLLRAAELPAVGARRPHRPGPGPPRRRAHRLADGPADPPHRPRADGQHHPHRAVPHRVGHLHPRLREPGRAGWRPQLSARPAEAAHVGRRTFPDEPGDAVAVAPSCSTRRPTPSRSCAGSGTAGRTTPRSATWRRAASSTGTSSTTSTSRAASSA